MLYYITFYYVFVAVTEVLIMAGLPFMFGPGGPILVGQVPIIPQVPIAMMTPREHALQQQQMAPPEYMSDEKLQEKGRRFLSMSYIQFISGQLFRYISHSDTCVSKR